MKRDEEKSIIDAFRSINIKNLNKTIAEESILSIAEDDSYMLYIPRKKMSIGDFEFMDSFIHFDEESSEFTFKISVNNINGTPSQIKESVKKAALNTINEEYRSQKEDVKELIEYRKQITKRVKEYREKVRQEKYQKFLDEQYGTIKDIFAAIDSREAKKQKKEENKKIESSKPSSKEAPKQKQQSKTESVIPNSDVDYDFSHLDEKQTIKDFMKETKNKSENVLKYLEAELRQEKRIHYKA